MIYEIKDGDELKILPFPTKDGKFKNYIKSTSLYIDGTCIYVYKQNDYEYFNELVKYCKNKQDKLLFVVRHWFCIYLNNEIKYITIGYRLTKLINDYCKIDTICDDHLKISQLKISQSFSQSFLNYDKSCIIQKDWNKSNISDFREFIIKKQDMFLEDYLDGSSLTKYIDVIQKKWPEFYNIMKSDNREKKLKLILN